jgi:hypothetical protein
MPSLDADANIHRPFSHSDWVITPLPFAPTAINDAGLIVGAQHGFAVQYQNGKVEVLLGAGQGSAAVDVSSTGAIVGTMAPVVDDADAVLWFPLPLRLPAGPVPIFMPTAINKHLAIVGTAGAPSAAFRWTSSDGFQFLNAPLRRRRTHAEIPTFVTDINDNGLAVGVVEHDDEASPVVWLPDGNGLLRWPNSQVFGHLNVRVNNHGAVAIADRDPTRNVSVLHLDGTVDSFPSIPESLSVDGFSDEGRIIGTSKVSGVTRAWTFYKNQLHWLDLPDGTRFQPTGVNSCGNIVGRISENAGVLFARPLPSRCDGAGVIHHL